MRKVLVAIAAGALALAAVPREAGACFEPLYEDHALDASQLDDTVAPGAVEVTMHVAAADGTGCGGGERTRCGPDVGRRIELYVFATDDRTPPDKLGYRIAVASGTAPFQLDGDVRPIGDRVIIPLAEDADAEFELQVRAVDLNGNVGPATIMAVEASSEGGCAVHGERGLAGFVAIGLALLAVVRRRRPRA